MKNYLLIAALFVASAASAQNVIILNNEYGSGVQGNSGATNAYIVSNEIDPTVYHAPQYLPYFPTAATIWPRVIEVPCREVGQNMVECDTYNWTPDMGRGEYLFFRRNVVVTQQPQVIIKEVKTPPVIIEVERKSKKQ